MYRALISFSGIISMAKDEIREIKDEYLIKDLIKSGYIEAIHNEKPKEEKPKKEKSKK